MATKRAVKKSVPRKGKVPVREIVAAMRSPIKTGSNFDLLVRTEAGAIFHIPGKELVNYRRPDIEADGEAIQALNDSDRPMIGLKNAIYIRGFVIMDGAG